MGVFKVLGVVEGLHDRDGGDVSHVGRVGSVATADSDAPNAAEGVCDSATQDPESPLVENTRECLSVEMTGHSLDSWYWPAK